MLITLPATPGLLANAVPGYGALLPVIGWIENPHNGLFVPLTPLGPMNDGRLQLPEGGTLWFKDGRPV